MAAAEEAEVDPAVARELLDGPLEGYVERRKAIVKRLRGEGDRPAAKAVEGLAKPTLTLFAVLRAADDPDRVQAAVDATEELARVQGGAGGREALTEATSARRAALEALVDAGLEASGLGGGPGLAGRADEVRAAVDRLTRHPEVVPAWLAGTLRELPDDGDAGFGALGLASVFAAPADDPTPRSTGGGTGKASTAEAATRPSRGGGRGTPARTRRAADAEEPAAGGEEAEEVEEAAPAVDAKAVARARKALDRAQRQLDDAEEAVADAREAAEEADAAVDAAREALAQAEQAAADAHEALTEAEDDRDGARDLVGLAEQELQRLEG